MGQTGPRDDGPPERPAVESRAVDERRQVRLQQAAVLILQRPDRHTPLEREWAQQVLDLTVALGLARRRLAELGDGAGSGAPTNR